MNIAIEELYNEMNKQLQEVTMSVNNPVQMSVRSYRIVEQTLVKLKELIINHRFADKEEEIHFFKHIEPMFLKELVYYWEVYQIEKWKPPVGKENEINHYLIGARRMDLYFKLNNEFYAYYQTDSTDHDELYFLRSESGGGGITNISIAVIDPRFSTAYSIEFATMQAYEKFSTYLRQCIHRLEHPNASTQPNDTGDPVTWTDAKADLIELGYGIHAKGSLNYGNANLKQIMTALGKIFNVDLGNYYSVFQKNIRLRKRKNRTQYLETVIEYFERKMDDLDANPVRS